MSEFKKYSSYKDSGVEWLGMVPEHWDTQKLKHFLSIQKGRNPKIVTSNPDFLPYLTMDVLRGRDIIVNYVEHDDGLLKVSDGDILVLWDGANAGEIIKAKNGYLSSTMASLEPINERFGKAYLYYLLKSKERFLKDFAGGTTIPHLDPQSLIYTPVPIPPLTEQTAIANYLNQKTTQIDRAIELKEQTIALLKERKQIVIQELVTGKWKIENGELKIRDKTELKDSGVDWIGEVPKEWEVKALKYIAYLESGQTISSESFVEEGYPVYGGNGFRGYAQTFTNEGEHALIGRQGALCGNVNYAKGKFFASEHAIVVYHKKNVNILWLGETIKVADFNRLSQSAAQPGIAVSVIKDQRFPYPSFEEQNKIAYHIEQESTKIDSAISLQEQEIEKLKELKATLIDGAVRGRIKV